MAKPDLDDGYLRYAHELDSALACADFTKGARIVLREVFAQIFGPAKLKTAKVSPTELAKLYGSDKGYFGRSIRELVDSGAMEKLGECEYRFLKDYETWTKGGESRFTKDELAMILSAPERAMSHKRSSGGNSVNAHKQNQQTLPLGPGCNPVNDRGAIQSTETIEKDRCVVNPVNGSLTKLHPCVSNPVNDAHYIEPARLETGDLREEAAPLRAPAHAPARTRGDEVQEPDYPDGDSMFIAMPGPVEIADPEARRIWSMLWRQWKSRKLCVGFYEHQRFYPASAWIEAVREAARRDVNPSSIGYIEKIAADIAVNGVRGHSAPEAPARRRGEPNIKIHRKGDPL